MSQSNLNAPRFVLGEARANSQENLQVNSNEQLQSLEHRLSQVEGDLKVQLELVSSLQQTIAEKDAEIEKLSNQNQNLNETITTLRATNNGDNNSEGSDKNDARTIELENKVKDLENKIKELESALQGAAASGGGGPPPPPAVGGGPPPPPPPPVGGGPPPPPPPPVGGGPPPPPPPPVGGGPPPPPPPPGLSALKKTPVLRKVNNDNKPPPSPTPVDGRSSLLDSIAKGVTLKKTGGPKPAEEKLKEIEKAAPKSPANNHMAALAAALANKRAGGEDLLKKLERRPSRKELEEKNILKDGSEDTDSSIVATRFALKKAQDRDLLNKKISARPTLETLEEKNIIQKNEDDQPEWMKKRLSLKSPRNNNPSG